MPHEQAGEQPEVTSFTNPLTGEKRQSPPGPERSDRLLELRPIEDFSADFARPPVGEMSHLERRSYRMAAFADASPNVGPANSAGYFATEFLSRARPVQGTEHMKITDHFRPGVIRKGWEENLTVTARRLRENQVQPQFEPLPADILAQMKDQLLVPIDDELASFEQEMLSMAVEAEEYARDPTQDEYRAKAARTLAARLVDELARNVWLGRAETVQANRALWHRAFPRLLDDPEQEQAA